MTNGPVKIIDAKGVYPENLDNAVKERANKTGWDLSKLPVDSIWGYKGVPYRIMLTPDANTLIQYNDVWYPCIKYRNAEFNGKTYYRSSREFLEKFNRLS